MPDTAIPLDRAHYDAIITTAEAVKHIAEDVAELKARKCPCDAVLALQSDSTSLKIKVAGIAGTVSVLGTMAIQALQGVR